MDRKYQRLYYKALYLKTIPIVVKHKTHDNLDNLPILFINNLDEIKDYSKDYSNDDFNRIYNEIITQKLLDISYFHTYRNIDRGILEVFGPSGIINTINFEK